MTSVHLVTLLAADIVSTQASIPGEAREFSRVEMIMRARDTAYVQLPAHSAVLPSHTEEPKAIDEPKAVASHLAIEIDRAELNDARGQQFASLRAPSHHESAILNVARSSRAAAKTIKPPQLKIAAANEPELKKLRSPVPEPEVAAITSLKAAVQAQTPAKPEPIRKKLAHRDPTAGELIRMQLLNQI